jgi:hypothetical protein
MGATCSLSQATRAALEAGSGFGSSARTTPTGMAPLGNGNYGVLIENGAQSNLIGTKSDGNDFFDRNRGELRVRKQKTLGMDC